MGLLGLLGLPFGGKMGKRREKLQKMDGLGPWEVSKIRSAIRQVWQYRSLARQLAIKRCTKKDGFTYCEGCKKRTPKLKVDHFTPVGEVDGGYIQRLFVPSNRLQGLCKKCHNIKTHAERASEGDLKQRSNFYQQHGKTPDEMLAEMNQSIEATFGVKSDTSKRVKKKRDFTDEF